MGNEDISDSSFQPRQSGSSTSRCLSVHIPSLTYEQRPPTDLDLTDLRPQRLGASAGESNPCRPRHHGGRWAGGCQLRCHVRPQRDSNGVTPAWPSANDRLMAPGRREPAVTSLGTRSIPVP